jgi:predicted acyltransferase
MATITQSPEASVTVETADRGSALSDPSPKPSRPDRLVSLDAFRGFIMTTLAAEGFALATLSDDPSWGWLGRQFQHVQWEGIGFWDLIQPAFMFMVGLAMPFAFGARARRGGDESVWRHVAYRAVMLIAISNVMMSISAGRMHFQLINVLAQIGITYFICYWLMKLSFKIQAVSAGLIMAAYTVLFTAFPGSGGTYSIGDNIGERIDQFVLGAANPGHWATINFIPSIVVTLFGVWCGYLMIEKHSHAKRMKLLAGGAAACFAVGYALSPFIPIIKRIHTASYTFAACGWVLLMLLGFYWLVEVRGLRSITFPLVVVGMNSMFVYCLYILFTGWIDESIAVFTGEFAVLGKWGPVAQAVSIFIVMWYMCHWLYKRRLFIKI